MTRPGLALRALRLTVAGSKADPIRDYDVASADYDAFFSRVMGTHSLGLLEQVTLAPGDRVVELACGTGHLSTQIARRLAGRGAIRAVDKSAGMLAVARRKLAGFPELEVVLEERDMDEFLRAQPTASSDVIVCGWAICYSRPVQLLRQAARVLRPGGQVAIIETRADALAVMRHVLERVVADDPTRMTAMIRVALPKRAAVLDRWFRKAGLVTTMLREGEQVLPCATPHDALEWVERSGAGAGFRDAFDEARADEIRQRVIAELAGYTAAHGPLRLRHTFVMGIARSPMAEHA